MLRVVGRCVAAVDGLGPAIFLRVAGCGAAAVDSRGLSGSTIGARVVAPDVFDPESSPEKET